MSECRVCLSIKKNARSIFEPTDRNIKTTYADMITYVASVKIMRDDGITDQICPACCRKLRDIYDFKLLIQRSNTSLHQKVKSFLKIIHFNDVTEIKLEVDITQTDDKNLVNKEYGDFKINLLGTEDSICYSNTTIKKLRSNIANENVENETMTVMDFLNTIKEDPDDKYDNDLDIGQHEDTDGDEYIPPNVKQKRKYEKKCIKNKKHKLFKMEKKGKGKKTELHRVLIKPIMLDDLKVMPTYDRKRPKKKATYKSRQKESICPYCGKITKSLYTHMLVHGEPKFKCDMCDKGYYTRRALNHHKDSHSNIKEFKCDQCVAAFHNINSLRSHKQAHEDIRKFVCPICSKDYKRRQQLARHVKTHNSANKSHKCELCNMSFFSQYGLRHHMRVHTGERPYNCELCSQPYSYKHDFNRHCLKKHGIFLKRRSVNVMNEEVLARERLVMRELMLRAHGIVKEDEPAIPFDGPQAAQAFEQAINTFRKNPLTLSLQS